MDNAHNRRAEDRRAPGALQWGEPAASTEPVGESVNAANVTLDKVCDLFGIGALARSESTILENVRNAIRREECLSAIERTFFMVPAEPDEDFPDEDPGEECLLGWGRNPQQYVEQFRAALMHVATQASVEQATGAKEGDALTDAVRDVVAERRRQVEQEGWTPEHDDAYQSLELNRAAASYTSFGANEAPGIWPWPREWWKPTSYRRNMVKAAALLLAEIERIDRASTAGAESGAKGGAS